MTQDFLICFILGSIILLLGFLAFYIFKLKKRLDVFLKGENKDLEALLKELVEHSQISKQDIEDIFKKVSWLENIAKVSLQKVGIIRYNPFKNVGGNQSFSIALLDNQDSGFVITSLFIKEVPRIFAKPVKNGKSEYPLSEEEKKAIEQAQTRH